MIANNKLSKEDLMKIKKFLAFLLVAIAFTVFSQSAVLAGPIGVDPDLPNYKKSSGVSGNLSSIGSDTLNNLMAL
jgi:phosphate transport system substrate-binding protein